MHADGSSGHHQAPRHRRRGHRRDGHRPAALRDRRARLPRPRRGHPAGHGHAHRRRPGPGTGQRRPGRAAAAHAEGRRQHLGGFRNAMTFVLCGLDIEAKAALVRAQLRTRSARTGWSSRWPAPTTPDAADTEAASALLHVHLKRRRPEAGRAGVLGGRGGAGARLVPGLHADHPARRRDPVRRLHRRRGAAGRGRARGGAARRRARRRSAAADHVDRGVRRAGRAPARTDRRPRRSSRPTRPGAARRRSSAPARATRAATPTSASGRAPTTAYAWLRGWLTVERLRELLPGDRRAAGRALRAAEPARGQLRDPRAARRRGRRVDPVRPAGQGARRAAALASSTAVDLSRSTACRDEPPSTPPERRQLRELDPRAFD